MEKLRLFRKIVVGDGNFCLNRRKMAFIKRVLVEDEDIELVSSIFSCTRDTFPTDKIKMVDFINYYGIENIYLGSRSNFGVSGQMNGEVYSYSWETSRPSVFRHDEFDTYYYDLLDNDKKCELIPMDELGFRDGCSGMRSVSQVLEKEKMMIRR